MVMVKPQSSPLMETVKLDEIDATKTAYQPNSKVLPLIETVRSENQRLHIELGNFAGVAESVYDGLRNGHLSELEVVK